MYSKTLLLCNHIVVSKLIFQFASKIVDIFNQVQDFKSVFKKLFISYFT